MIAITVHNVPLWDFVRVGTKGNIMNCFCKTTIATRILMLVGASIATPAAAASFDGQWSVQIASTSAACPSGASVSIGISNGQVASTNTIATASGRVADAGSINVTPDQRDQAGRRLGPSHRQFRIGRLARRAVLGYLDRTAHLSPATAAR